MNGTGNLDVVVYLLPFITFKLAGNYLIRRLTKRD